MTKNKHPLPSLLTTQPALVGGVGITVTMATAGSLCQQGVCGHEPVLFGSHAGRLGGSKIQAVPSSSPPPFRLRALTSLNCPSPPTTPSRQRSVNNVAAEPGSPSSFLESRGAWASPTPRCRHTTLPPAPPAPHRPSDPAVINLASGGQNGHSLSRPLHLEARAGAVSARLTARSLLASHPRRGQPRPWNWPLRSGGRGQ